VNQSFSNTWTIQPFDQPEDRFRSVFGRDPNQTDIERHGRARLLLALGMPRAKVRVARVIAGQ
jgi:hypothetical protein